MMGPYFFFALVAGLVSALAAGLGAGALATGDLAAGVLATAGLAAGFAAALGAVVLAGLSAAAAEAFAVADVTALDFAAGLGLEAAVAGFGDADLDTGDLAMNDPTPRFERMRGRACALVAIRNHNGV